MWGVGCGVGCPPSCDIQQVEEARNGALPPAPCSRHWADFRSSRVPGACPVPGPPLSLSMVSCLWLCTRGSGRPSQDTVDGRSVLGTVL